MSIIQEALRKAEEHIKDMEQAEARPPESKMEGPEKAAAQQAVAPAVNKATKAKQDTKTVAMLLVLLVLAAVFAASQFFPRKAAAPKQAAGQEAAGKEEAAPASLPKEAPAAPVKAQEFPTLQSVLFKQPEEKKPASPEFVLNGIMYLEGSPRAIVNDVMVEPGDTVNGAKVVKIDRQDVVLLYNGSEIVLKLK